MGEFAGARVVELATARLLELGNALAGDPELRRRADFQATAVVSDCLTSMAAGRVVVDRHGLTVAAGLGPVLIDQGIALLEAVRAGGVLCDVVAQVLTESPGTPPDRAWIGLRAAQSSVGERLEAIVGSYGAVVTARTERRGRLGRRALARELHDFVGSNLNLAQRHLELHRLYQERQHPSAPRELEAAEQVLRDVMAGTRRLMSDLRAQPPVSTLALALRTFVTSVAPCAAVDLRVEGDEMLLGDHERDELYLMCQEGLRNAFTHARAGRVTVRVSIGPGVTEAVVEDDGRGFDRLAGLGSAPGHHGLAGLRERAELLGGTFELTSSPRAGTRARIRIPTHGPTHGLSHVKDRP